ncbi:MAG: twitching motility protein PilT [Desulfobacteraceae bacterium]|nr:twitching motility protein PilT [Desulfobacteraceae bacterium]MBC2755784.1 twitching motility protein PilT [Desulfobacteraceae bacterium]
MKINVIIRFYEELNDYLKPGGQKQDIYIDIEKGICVGNLIESLGPPCSSVDLVLVNGQPVDFDSLLQNNDRVSVYPVFEMFDIKSVSILENSPLRQLKFICDDHLGRLAKYLRIFGFDTLYENDYDDNIMIQFSNTHNRILLTRDKKLLLDKKITRRYLVKQTDPVQQVREVLEFFDLKNYIMPMSRCLKCNGLVHPVLKETVKHRVDNNIFQISNAFSECTGCGKLYWKGSHYDSMMKWIQEMMD